MYFSSDEHVAHSMTGLIHRSIICWYFKIIQRAFQKLFALKKLLSYFLYPTGDFERQCTNLFKE